MEQQEIPEQGESSTDPTQPQVETRAQRRRKAKEERQAEQLRSRGANQNRDGVPAGMNSYIQCMEEITRRSVFIRDFGLLRFPEPAAAETLGLQLRKILELIAKASLVAHRSVWEEASLWFKRDWNAKEILGRIEEVNPPFYPRPVRELWHKPGHRPTSEWEAVPDDLYLTKERFIEVYDAIGDMMHAHFPDESIDYHGFSADTVKWDGWIHELLQMHQVFLIDSGSFYLVQMNVNGTPVWSPWSRLDSPTDLAMI